MVCSTPSTAVLPSLHFATTARVVNALHWAADQSRAGARKRVG